MNASCGELPGKAIIERIKQEKLAGQTPVIGHEVFQHIETSALIDCLEYYMCIWLKKPIRLLCKDPDLDFAILAILNAVPEFLDKMRYPFFKDQPDKPKIRIKRGLEYIFGNEDKEIVNYLYGRLRNEIAHSYFTREGIRISRDYDKPVEMCQDQKGKKFAKINPLLLSDKYLDAVDRYISELRKDLKNGDKDTPLLRNFKKYMGGVSSHRVTWAGKFVTLAGKFVVLPSSDSISSTINIQKGEAE